MTSISLPFKRIDENNWLEPDKASTGFAKVGAAGKYEPMEGRDYVKRILQPQLTKHVPVEVHEVFEIAKGAIAYGFFFYPLFSLGTDQILRAAETATTYKCKSLQAPEGVNNFQRQIDWLKAQDVLSSSKASQWKNICKLRNITSHPKHASFGTPAMAFKTLDLVTTHINELFSIS